MMMMMMESAGVRGCVVTAVRTLRLLASLYLTACDLYLTHDSFFVFPHMIPFSSSRMLLLPPPRTLLRKRTTSTPRPPPRKRDRERYRGMDRRDRVRSPHQRSRKKTGALLASRAEDSKEARRKERRKASRDAGQRKTPTSFKGSPRPSADFTLATTNPTNRAVTRAAASNVSALTESRDAVAVLVKLVQFVQFVVVHRVSPVRPRSGAVPSARCRTLP